MITMVAGTDWVFPGNRRTLSEPLGSLQGVTVDNSGNIYLTDALNNLVAREDSSGDLTVVAGNGLAGYSGDGGPALNASLNAPTGIARDSAGNLYFRENLGYRVRRYPPTERIPGFCRLLPVQCGGAVRNCHGRWRAGDYHRGGADKPGWRNDLGALSRCSSDYPGHMETPQAKFSLSWWRLSYAPWR
jgi:hypothetical protein